MNKQLTELQGQIDLIKADMRQAFERIARLERKPEPKRPVKPFVIYWTGVALLWLLIAAGMTWTIASFINISKPGSASWWAIPGAILGGITTLVLIVSCIIDFCETWEQARRDRLIIKSKD